MSVRSGWYRFFGFMGLVVGLLLSQSAPAQEPDHYILPPPPPNNAAHNSYFPKLVELALDKTQADYGPYRISVAHQLKLSTGRIARELFSGQRVNLIWTMTTDCLEKRLRAIKVPLLKGANGYRLFLIKEGRQNLFDEVETLQDLAELRAGQADHWPDTTIMRRNGLPVETSTNYESLVNMLRAERFDYFPRGAYEIFEEHKVVEGTVIEQRLALSYEAPIYFFMSPRSEKLAERLEVGLERSLEDGSFDELFNSTPGFSEALKAMANKDRQVFELTANVSCAFRPMPDRLGYSPP